MDKQTILERSRQENRKQDERERGAMMRAEQIACAVGGLVCAFIIVYETLFAKTVSLSTWAVYLSITGTTLLVKYLNLRRTHELVFGLIQLGLAAAALVLHVLGTLR